MTPALLLLSLWAAADDNETIYVVEAKPFLAAGTVEVTPQLAQSVNDEFTSHTGAGVSLLYNLRENVAFELEGAAFGWLDDGGPRLGGRDSDETVELRIHENLKPERVKLYQFPWLVAADAQWNPFYGKVALQDAVLGQFALYVSVGAGLLGLELASSTLVAGRPTPYVELPPTLGVLPAMAPTTSFGGGLKVRFTDWLGARIEVRDYVAALAVRADASTEEELPSFDVTNLVLAKAGVVLAF